MTETAIQYLERSAIKPSKNPRKNFDADKLKELAESIRAQGIIQPLLVRPDWCIGKSSTEISTINGNAPTAIFHELIAGERRYRAAGIAELAKLPAIVRPLSDQEALELQLIENLQRDDLDPFEEAEGYQGLLNLRDAKDKPVHTVESIHLRVGKPVQRIYYRLKLLRVPDSVRSAVKTGLSVEIAEMIGGVTTSELRASAAEEILHPEYEEGPLNVRKARELISSKYMRSLAGAPFDQADAGIVPPIIDGETGERYGGGACTDCPKRTGNMEAIVGKTKRPDVCTNPQCFLAKCDAQFVRMQAGAASEGKRVLTSAEAADIFDNEPNSFHFGAIRFEVPYVKLSDRPDAQEVRSDFSGRIPRWEALLKGLQSVPPILVARDPKDRIVELVDRHLAIEAINLAAKQKGEASIFGKSSSSAATANGSDDQEEPEWKRQERKNKEIAKLNFQVTLAAVTELIGKIDKQGPVKGFWDALIEASIDHAGHDGCWLICKRLGLDPKAENGHTNIEGVQGAALEYGLTLPDDKLKLGYLVELLLSQRVKIYNSGSMGGVRQVPSFKSFAKLYDVDMAEVERRVKGEEKEKQAAKGRAKPDGKIVWERRPATDYKFNSNGVCTNESILRLPFAKSSKVKVDIRVALVGKKWVTGYDASWGAPTANGSGAMSAAPAKGRESYKTLREALVSEAQSLHKHLKNSLAPAVVKLLEMHVGTIKTMELPEAATKPAEHKFEHIAENKYRCKSCGAPAVKHEGELLVAKEFRGKPCSQSEKPKPKKSAKKPVKKK